MSVTVVKKVLRCSADRYRERLRQRVLLDLHRGLRLGFDLLYLGTMAHTLDARERVRRKRAQARSLRFLLAPEALLLELFEGGEILSA